MNSLRILYLSGRSLVLAAVIFSGALLIPPQTVRAADEEKLAEKNMTERTGTVDAVYKDRLVIDDATVLLDGNVKLYNQYGSNADQSLFEEGDQVAVAFAEDDQAGKRWLVYVKLAKKGSGKKQNASSEQADTKDSSVIKKVNGVWTN